MIGKLANLAWGGLLYFSLATVIAQAIMVGYAWSKWELSRAKIARMVAVAQGVESAPQGPAAAAESGDAPPEQVSFQQVLQARALKDKDLELRELALVDALAQLRTGQQKLANDQKQLQLNRADYEAKLAAAAGGAANAGQEEVRRILQSIKPKQAKEILLGMLDNKEVDEVVTLLEGMTDSKRAKIFAEFKTAEETKKIDEVLRQIRKGVPEAPLAQQAMGKLGAPNPPPP